MNKFGIYRLSTIPNSRAQNWSPSKRRFEDEQKATKEVPGPGNYDLTDSLSANGRYLLSKYKSYGTQVYRQPSVIGRKRRNISVMDETPGPGSYSAMSEFGNLEINKK